MSDFAVTILLVSLAGSLAIGFRVLSDRWAIPAAALLLIVSAALSDVFNGLHEALSIADVQRLATVALIVILVDGGMHIGMRRFRAAAAPILTLGLVGTFGTMAIVAVTVHELLDVSWTVAGLIGAAVAPTDPAVTFAVLGKREIRGRAGTILEGESGFNDPVGIALMIGMVEFATSDDAGISTVVTEVVVELAIGLGVGVAGGLLLQALMRRLPLPDSALYPLRVLFFAGVVFGAAGALHGSGFLAVFVTGIMIGDSAAPHKGEVERFHTALASLAEIAVFIALGLTVDLGFIFEEDLWLDGLVVTIVLIALARPLAVGALLLPFRLSWGERGLVIWGGLKGAVPILLASVAVVESTEFAAEIYGIVFVVVLVSVLLQGTSLPYVATKLHVPMRIVEPDTIEGRRVVVSPGAYADGRTVRELPLAERAWLSSVDRDGTGLVLSGRTRLQAGDVVRVYCDDKTESAVRRVFEGE
jgi:potassium/hydrogen antiporter